jgi:hypothetical protein
MIKSLLPAVMFFFISISCFGQKDFFTYLPSNELQTKIAYGEIQSHAVKINPDFLTRLPRTVHYTIALSPSLNVDIRLDQDVEQKYKGMMVWKGRTSSAESHHPNYRNSIIVYNPASNKLTAMFDIKGKQFVLLPTQISSVYRISEYQSELAGCQTIAERKTQSIMSNLSCGYCTETDQNGHAVLDMFIGFSDAAATVAGDLDAYGLMVVEDVNTGLSNSMITGVYMRLVGTGTTPNNPGVVTSVLSDAWDWFATDIETTGADFISVFQTFTGAQNEAGGWAGVPGRSSVNGVTLPAAFRHEVGHNVGAGHCPGDGSVLPYAHGFNNGNWTTHMCGNATNYYSNPAVNDNLGNPIGDPSSADMARVWQERASLISGHAIHKVPYFQGDVSVDFDGDNICGIIDCDDHDNTITFGCSTEVYSDLVNNVDTVHIGGAPGSLYLTSISSIPLVSNPFSSNCPSLFVAGGLYGKGRFITVGHDGLLRDESALNFDNPAFILNAFNWMNDNGSKVIKMTSGHAEWVNAGNTPVFQTLVTQDGFQVMNLPGTITASSLTDVDILVIGNAWSTISPAEITAIHDFVSNGGGLFMLGLGWSYMAFVGPLSDYAMNQIASPMGVEWIDGVISDPINQFDGSPLFTYFYPYINMRTPCDLGPSTICQEDEIFVHQVDEPLYQAIDIINSDAHVPCDATFKGATSISLEPGFSVPIDVTFSAVIEQCPTNR